MTCDVVVLVSVGRHPFSGRARGAELDSRALELALSLPGQVRVRVLHAGDPNEPALRDYLGSGAECVTVLQVSDTFDPLPSLVRYLADLHPTLVLTGMTAERGKCTGFLPYALAHALNFPLVSNVIALGMGAESVGVLQALPRGQRRRIEAPVPLLVMVDQAAPAPRGYAFARARRGRIEVLSMTTAGDALDVAWPEVVVRRRPRRITIPATGGVDERLRAATEQRPGRGRLLVYLTAEQAAHEIYDYLTAEGILGHH